jgi:hypothetical protein
LIFKYIIDGVETEEFEMHIEKEDIVDDVFEVDFKKYDIPIVPVNKGT